MPIDRALAILQRTLTDRLRALAIERRQAWLFYACRASTVLTYDAEGYVNNAMPCTVA